MRRLQRFTSPLIALGLLLLLLAWLASGHLLGESTEAVDPHGNDAVQTEPFRVAVESMAVGSVERVLINQGQTEANRIVTVRNETAGTVERVLAAKGERVSTGDGLLQLRMDDRDIRLADARALLAQRQAEYNAAENLGRDGFQSRTAVQQAAAALERARAELRAVELDRERTTIRAPFDGVINDRLVEVGDYLALNTQTVQVVETDPLVVVINVSQNDVRRLQVGQTAEIRLRRDETRQGAIRFIASAAEAATRTFRVELEIPNGEHSLPAGISAEVHLPVGSEQAHRLSPALLALDAGNDLVVKAVDRDDRVVYHPVDIVRSERDGVWVTGIPDGARVITAGAAFVIRGQQVKPVIGGNGIPD